MLFEPNAGKGVAKRGPEARCHGQHECAVRRDRSRAANQRHARRTERESAELRRRQRIGEPRRGGERAEHRRRRIEEHQIRRGKMQRRVGEQQEGQRGVQHADQQVRAPMTLDVRVEPNDREPRDERHAGDRRAEHRGPHGPERRHEHTEEHERQAPDRRQRGEPRDIGLTHVKPRAARTQMTHAPARATRSCARSRLRIR